MNMVVEHKHSIGFDGTLLIEPKPCEPTKHQYDYDAAACYAFLQKYGIADEFKLNIECNHATLAGHTFQHEVAYAIAHGIFGSVDANRGDAQNGWDTDQFPNGIEEATLVLREILGAGGLGSGGFNFDAKLRRQSMAREDLFHGHIGGMDTLARGLVNAAALIEGGELESNVADRYAGWGRRARPAHPRRHRVADIALGACARGQGRPDARERPSGTPRKRGLALRQISPLEGGRPALHRARKGAQGTKGPPRKRLAARWRARRPPSRGMFA